jgi:hypothetical protein
MGSRRRRPDRGAHFAHLTPSNQAHDAHFDRSTPSNQTHGAHFVHSTPSNDLHGAHFIHSTPSNVSNERQSAHSTASDESIGAYITRLGHAEPRPELHERRSRGGHRVHAIGSPGPYCHATSAALESAAAYPPIPTRS